MLFHMTAYDGSLDNSFLLPESTRQRVGATMVERVVQEGCRGRFGGYLAI